MGDQNHEIQGKFSVALVCLSLIGAVLAYLSLDSFIQLMTGSITESFCNINASVNCDAVSRSEWATIEGIPQATIALWFYLCFSVFALAARLKGGGERCFLTHQVFNDCAVTILLAVLLYSLWLLYVSIFYVKTVCILCIGMDLVNVTLFLMVWYVGRARPLFVRVWSGVSLLVLWPIAAIGFSSVNLEAGRPLLQRAALIVGGVLVVLIMVLSFILTGYLEVVSVSKGQTGRFAEVYSKWSNAEPVDMQRLLNKSSGAVYRRGAVDAPVQIVKFFDYECPACRDLHFFLEDVLEQYGDSVALTLKNYPLDKSCNDSMQQELHRNACFAAHLARCAGEQGKFWVASDLIFGFESFEVYDIAREELTAEFYPVLQEMGIDMAALKECITSGRQLVHIRRDVEIGNELGIDSTPSLWIDGRKLDGVSAELIEQVFDAVLNQKNS